MKIIHLIYSFNTGGAETMLVDIANEQVTRADVSIVIINSIYNQELLSKIDKRIEVHLINRKEGSMNLLPTIRLNRFLLRMKSDVLHCHNPNIIPLLLPSLKKKSVLTIHGVNLNKKYFRQYMKLFAISQIVQGDIYKRSGLYSILVYNGICTEKILKKEENVRSDIFKVVIVSSLLHKVKGQHLAIEAIKLLKERGITNINLDLIGSGSSDNYLKTMTANYNLTHYINFLGLKDRDYIYNHLMDYDLLIQPSLSEGFGLSVVEAMAAKVPVLVSNIEGPLEIIELGKYGYYFQSGNTENLAEQIHNIKSNFSGEQIKQKVEAAYKHVKTNFEISTTAQRYLISY
jgi:glycosyltransferase involved in cell wall biosynthesis